MGNFSIKAAREIEGLLGAETALSIRRSAACAVDYQRLPPAPCGFEFKPSCCSIAVKNGGLGASAGATGTSPPNCVSSGAQSRSKSYSRQARLVHHRPVEQRALQQRSKIAHGRILRRQMDALRIDRAESIAPGRSPALCFLSASSRSCYLELIN